MREAPEYGKHSPHAVRNLRTACDGRRCRSPASSRRQSRRRAPTAADMPPPFRQNPAGRRRSGRLPANRPARTAVFQKQPRKRRRRTGKARPSAELPLYKGASPGLPTSPRHPRQSVASGRPQTGNGAVAGRKGAAIRRTRRRRTSDGLRPEHIRIRAPRPERR